MDKKILQFNTYSEALESVINSIKKRKVDLNVKHILIVPKTHTLFFEQALASDNNGFFDIEVFSLNRLYYKLGGSPLLNKEGAIMLLRQIVNKMDLKCFNKSKNYLGFCTRLYETISRLYISGIKAEDLKGEKGLKLKLDDIKRIYKEFLALSESINIEKGGMVKALKENERLENFFSNAYVYVLNFDCLSKTEEQLFDLISVYSKGYVKTQIKEGAKINANIEIYPAMNRAESIKAVSRRILKARNEGTDYEEMCLICSLESYDSVKRIFSEYEIPFYADIKIKLNNHSITRFLLDLINLKSVSKRDIISLSKNPLSKIENNKAEIFENYINRFSLNYLSFSNPFSSLEAEEVRLNLLKIISHFWTNIKRAKSKEEFCLFIERFIDSIETDLDKTQLVKGKIKEILNLILKTYLGDYSLNLLLELLIQGIDSSFLHPLPLSSSCIMIGSPVTFRGKKHKYAFILDFNEGIMPKAELECGVINESDFKLDLSPSLEKINLQNEIEIRQIFYSTKNLFISYIDSSSMRPSPLLYEVKKEKNVVNNSYLMEREKIDCSLDEQLVDFACCKSGALEHLLISINNPDTFTASLYEVLKEDAKKFLFKNKKEKINYDIFFNSSTTSVTQLQTYFDCPYKHFIKYGLRARDEEKGEITFLDIGVIVHLVMQRFCNSSFNESGLEEIITKAINEFEYKLNFISGYKERLTKEIKKLCLIFKENILKGKYNSFKAEVKLNPISIEGVDLIGSIDYLDFYDDYVRIIDYKTSGEVSLESKHIYYGLKLQLPLYMQSLIEKGYKPCAMLYFPFKARFEASTNFIGIYNSSLETVLLSDSNLLESKESWVITAKIKQTKKGISISGKGAKKEEEIYAICKNAYDTASLAVKQIKEGNIIASPYKDGLKNSCKYCDYLCSCDFDSVSRTLPSPSKKGDRE